MINSLTRMPVTIYFRPRGQHIRLYMYIVHLYSYTFLQIHIQNKLKAKLSFTLEKQTVFFWTRAKEHHFWSQDIDPTQKSIAIRPSFLYICCVATMILSYQHQTSHIISFQMKCVSMNVIMSKVVWRATPVLWMFIRYDAIIW